MEQKIKETEEETTMAEQTQGFEDINADSDIPGNTHLSNEAGENALEKLQGELEEQKDKYIRFYSDGRFKIQGLKDSPKIDDSSLTQNENESFAVHTRKGQKQVCPQG